MVNKFVMANKYDQAEKLYKELLREYPDSFAVRENYVGFLVSRERYSEASKEVEEGLRQSPGNPKLRIYQDGLARLSAAPSTEQKNAARFQMIKDIMDAGTILLNVALGKIK